MIEIELNNNNNYILHSHNPYANIHMPKSTMVNIYRLTVYEYKYRILSTVVYKIPTVIAYKRKFLSYSF